MEQQIIDLALSLVVEVSNYRTVYPVEHITALADSMIEHGYDRAFPVKVQALPDGIYKLIAGHCRTRAARQAGLATIPALLETETDPAKLALSQLRENENRLDPSDMDRARGYRAALDKGATMEQLGKATGKNKDYIERRLALLNLIPDIQELVGKGILKIMYANEIARLTDPNFQRLALSTYNRLSRCDLEDLRAIVNDLYTKQAQANLFDSLPMWGAAYTEALADRVIAEHKASRAELEAELTALREARERERAELERIKASATREIYRLRALLKERDAA